MAKIKNWTVTSQSVKNKTSGLIEYMDYVNNPKHDNHLNTEVIDLYKNNNDKSSRFIKKCVDEAITLDLKNLENRKGGRPVESYAVSFDLTLPKNTIRPTKEQWIRIGKDVVSTIAKALDNKLTSEHVYMNVHDQINPHLNLMISKVIDGNRERKIDQKHVLNLIKQQFNKSVLEHCDFDYRDYVPESINLGKKKQKWAYDLEQIKKAHKQFEALINYSNENNLKRVNSSKNRIIKTLSNVSLNNQNEFLSIADDLQDDSLKSALNDIRKALESSRDDTGTQTKQDGQKVRNRPN